MAHAGAPAARAGFLYDAATNRYYREQPAHRCTESQRRILEERAARAARDDLRRALARAPRWQRFSAAHWRFAPGAEEERDARGAAAQLRPFGPQPFGLRSHVCGAPADDPAVVEGAHDVLPSHSEARRGILRSGGDADSPLCVAWDARAVEVVDGALGDVYTFCGAATLRPPRFPRFVRYTHLAYRHPGFVLAVEDAEGVRSTYVGAFEDATAARAPAAHRVPTLERAVFAPDGGFVLAATADAQTIRLDCRAHGARPAPHVCRAAAGLSVTALGFAASDPAHYLVGATGGAVKCFQEDRLVASLAIGRSAARQLWASSDGLTVYAETFHNQLLMFDTRWPARPSLLLSPAAMSSSLRQCRAAFSVSGDGQHAHMATLGDGYMFSWDLRRPALPSCVWELPPAVGTIRDCFVALRGGDRAAGPHLLVRPAERP